MTQRITAVEAVCFLIEYYCLNGFVGPTSDKTVFTSLFFSCICSFFKNLSHKIQGLAVLSKTWHFNAKLIIFPE